jgi:hypothetical protein
MQYAMTFSTTPAPFRNGLTIAILGLALGAFTLAGCDSAGSSSNGGSQVEVGFSSNSTSSTNALAKLDDPLVVGGTNGDTLQIDDIRFIVSEVELGGEADSAEFETEKPAFVDLPLNSSDVVSVVSGQIPPGTYNEFEFSVEDADLDEGEDEDGLQQLRQDIDDAGFSNWPNEASLVVIGSFTPSGGSAQSFTTFLDAEIEVEIEMEGRTFDVGSDDPARQLTVSLSPSNWFVSDGNPVDLSATQYQNPDELAEFEIEFERETEIEFDDD